ncbi:membrane-spanning 4-domains subfamily A member 4A-like [Hemibagrus wyckioides]|uniref:membrane-spanning 4-domains subfamily A member 4A-like n=1 Tax=Hemibagrus wyckioides TaxID=337641 RepID=UPI00266B503B|nr:membrane-spanning 4-domains subfamily A member 4A-like [Hemibagrus wyckioides]
MPLPALKTDPKSLGIVQIMNGAVILLFGIVLRNSDPLSVRSGAVYWGSLCFLSAGSLSVAVMDHRTSLVVKSSLVMNLLSAVAAVLTVIMFCVDLAKLDKQKDLSTPHKQIDHFSEALVFLNLFEILQDTFRMLLLFSVLEVCMAIWTFVLVWKSRNST